MLQNRNKGGGSKGSAAPPKPKKSAEPKTPENKKKKKTPTAAGAKAAPAQKPSIFASAVATRNNAKSKDSAVYNSASSATTANFGRVGAAQDGGSLAAGGYATNQSVSSSAAMHPTANSGQGAPAHKGIKPY